MKKLLISILSSTMLLSMVACAETTENVQDVTESTVATSLEATAVSSVETMVETLGVKESVVETLANQEFTVETLADLGEEISQATLSSGLSAEAAAAYAEVIENIIKKYGDNPDIDRAAVDTGLFVGRLVDFDQDGTEELYVSYISHVDYRSVEEGANSKTIKEEVWAYTGSAVKQVWSMEDEIELGWNSGYISGTIFLPYNGETLLVRYKNFKGGGNSRFCDSNYVIYSYSKGAMKEIQTLSASGSVDLGANLTGSYNVTYEIDGVSKKDSFYYSLAGDDDEGWYAYFDHDFLTMSNKKYDISKLEDMTFFTGWDFAWTYENCLPELKSTTTSTPSVSGTPVSGFSDVRSTDWFASYVEYVTTDSNFVSSILMGKGYTSSSFNPYGQATRGMVAEVITSLFYNFDFDLGSHATAYEEGKFYLDNFPDSRGSEFELDIYFCKGESVFAGYPDGTVGVNDPITREAFALAMSSFYLNRGDIVGVQKSDPSTLNQFSDKSEISSWAEEGVAWAITNGLMSGSDGAINPQGNLSRAELAVVAQKCHEEFKNANLQ